MTRNPRPSRPAFALSPRENPVAASGQSGKRRIPPRINYARMEIMAATRSLRTIALAGTSAG